MPYRLGDTPKSQILSPEHDCLMKGAILSGRPCFTNIRAFSATKSLQLTKPSAALNTVSNLEANQAGARKKGRYCAVQGRPCQMLASLFKLPFPNLESELDFFMLKFDELRSHTVRSEDMHPPRA